MAENDTLQEADFNCVKCGAVLARMKDPRVAQCLHVYDNQCLGKMRKGLSKGAKILCAYSGCGKEVGTTANKIDVGELRGLKEKHLAQVAESEDNDGDVFARAREVLLGKEDETDED